MNSMSFNGSPRRSAIARARIGVRGRAVDATLPARREHGGLAANRLHPAVQEVPADDALAAAVALDELPVEVLLVHGDVPLHELLVQDLNQHVTGDVGGKDGARRAGGAERSLREAAVFLAREEGAPV